MSNERQQGKEAIGSDDIVSDQAKAFFALCVTFVLYVFLTVIVVMEHKGQKGNKKNTKKSFA